MGKLLLALLPLFFIPGVSAQSGSEDFIRGFLNALEFILGTGEAPNILLVKLGLSIIIFAALFKGTEKVFSENKGVAAIIALIVTLMGVRFTPNDWFTEAGYYFFILTWGVALLVSPYLVLTRLFKGNLGKFLAICGYVVVFFVLVNLDYLHIDFGYYGFSLLDEVIFQLSNLSGTGIIVVGVLALLFLYWIGKKLLKTPTPRDIVDRLESEKIRRELKKKK